MTRQEKQDLIFKLNDLYSVNQFIFLVKINAVSAADTMSFRSGVRKSESYCLVAKNTLSRIAASNAGLEKINDHFSSQILTIFTNNPVEIAKLLGDYEKKGYSVVAGSDKTNVFTPEDVKKLSKVPSLPVLRATILGAILATPTKTVRIISESAASLARLISTRAKTN